MDTRPRLAGAEGVSALSVVFNQDNTCFSIGLQNGFAGMTIFKQPDTLCTELISTVVNSNPCESRVSRGI